jgi:hypothetical protein
MQVRSSLCAYSAVSAGRLGERAGAEQFWSLCEGSWKEVGACTIRAQSGSDEVESSAAALHLPTTTDVLSPLLNSALPFARQRHLRPV